MVPQLEVPLDILSTNIGKGGPLLGITKLPQILDWYLVINWATYDTLAFKGFPRSSRMQRKDVFILRQRFGLGTSSTSSWGRIHLVILSHFPSTKGQHLASFGIIWQHLPALPAFATIWHGISCRPFVKGHCLLIQVLLQGSS